MARLPWQHTRSRTKSGSEKGHLTNPQDWFSRHTGEPSRKALQDLVQAHKRENSNESNGSGSVGENRSRSRGNTVTSNDWQKGRSRAGSASDGGWSRPPSSHHAREGSISSTLDWSEGATKSLLTKGGMMLKRTGSKMSLSSSGSSSTLGLTSPPRANMTASNSSSRAEDIRSKISTPFGFQHVTHTEQSQFAGLSRIEESDLVDQYKAITRQSTAMALTSVDASNLGINATIMDNHSQSLEAPLPQLPSTPPRPVPPPKDELVPGFHAFEDSPVTAHDVSTRSTPRSPTYSKQPAAPVVDDTLIHVPSPFHDAKGQSKADTHGTGFDTKPLPDIPVIHAVTTEDNTARAMIATPLPTPPGGVSPAMNGEALHKRSMHHYQRPSVVLPRHMSFYPSAKASMPNLFAANHLSVVPRTLPRHHSDMALSEQAKTSQNHPTVRASMSFAAVDTMNWEDAVDEAWDEVDDISEVACHASRASMDEISSMPTLLDSFSSEDGQSVTSTPLMMAPLPTERSSPVVNVEMHKLESVQEDEPSGDLSGLGISSCPPRGNNSCATQFSRSSSGSFLKRRSSMHSANGTMTRSSSQESIILSIASSIVGTQRSSNSSLNMDDLVSSSKMHGEAMATPHSQEQEHSTMDHSIVQSARPESGCLPFNVYEQISKADSRATSHSAAHENVVPPVPSLPQHKYSKSTSRVAIPERRSSVAVSEGSRPDRKRSNTIGIRPRQSARISYSLFPTATQRPSADIH